MAADGKYFMEGRLSSFKSKKSMSWRKRAGFLKNMRIVDKIFPGCLNAASH